MTLALLPLRAFLGATFVYAGADKLIDPAFLHTTGPGSIGSHQRPDQGDPGVLLKLSDGSIVAFDAVCTHAGCTVEYDRGSGYLFCPCHGAAFDPTQGGQAVAGPTDQPLAPIPIHIDTASGRITLTA